MPKYTSIDQLPVELNIRDLGGIPAKGSGKKANPILEGVEYFNKCAGFQNIREDLNSPGELASLVLDEDQKGNLIDVLVSSYTASLAFSNEPFRKRRT